MADALAPTSFSIADIYAALGIPMNGDDTSYWNGRQQQGVSQQNVSTALPAINSQFQQLLGRDMQAGVAQHLDPILQNQGMQAVRQNIAGTDEYLNRMLNNPGQTNVPAWQQAARQGTMHQAMMPGSFWDYSNPLLSNPAEVANIMGFKDGSISQMLMDAFTDPESDLLKQLLGTKDDKDKKAATGGGRPQGNRFAPNPEGETFFERVRGY